MSQGLPALIGGKFNYTNKPYEKIGGKLFSKKIGVWESRAFISSNVLGVILIMIARV